MNSNTTTPNTHNTFKQDYTSTKPVYHQPQYDPHFATTLLTNPPTSAGRKQHTDCCDKDSSTNLMQHSQLSSAVPIPIKSTKLIQSPSSAGNSHVEEPKHNLRSQVQALHTSMAIMLHSNKKTFQFTLALSTGPRQHSHRDGILPCV